MVDSDQLDHRVNRGIDIQKSIVCISKSKCLLFPENTGNILAFYNFLIVEINFCYWFTNKILLLQQRNVKNGQTAF